YVVDCPKRVRRCAYCNDFRSVVDEATEIIEVELPRLRNHSNSPNAEATLFRQLPPGIDVRVVVELGHDDLVSRSELAAQRSGEVKRQRRHVGAEYDLVRRRVQ